MVSISLHRSRFVRQSHSCRHPQLLSFRTLQDSADAAAWDLDKLPCLLEKLLSQWAPCGLMGYVEGREREWFFDRGAQEGCLNECSGFRAIFWIHPWASRQSFWSMHFQWDFTAWNPDLQADKAGGTSRGVCNIHGNEFFGNAPLDRSLGKLSLETQGQNRKQWDSEKDDKSRLSTLISLSLSLSLFLFLFGHTLGCSPPRASIQILYWRYLASSRLRPTKSHQYFRSWLPCKIWPCLQLGALGGLHERAQEPPQLAPKHL